MLCAWLVAKSQGGRIVLRIEDLDRERSRQAFADSAMADLAALGLEWDEGPFYQHDRDDAYEEAYEKLARRGLVYPCFCTRAELNAQSAPHAGDRRVYSGRCRSLGAAEAEELRRQREREGRFPAIRIAVPPKTVAFEDVFQGPVSQDLAADCGDFVLRRSDGGFAYQLAVVVDDAAQGVTSVVRGYDLLQSTPQQVFLQRLLGFDAPDYGHIPLFCAADGRRLAKRDHDAEYGELLAASGSPEAVLGRVAWVGGLQDRDVPTTAQELLDGFSVDGYRKRIQGVSAIEFTA